MNRWTYSIIFFLLLLSFGIIGCGKKSADKDIVDNAVEVEKFTESETKNKSVQEINQKYYKQYYDDEEYYDEEEEEEGS